MERGLKSYNDSQQFSPNISLTSLLLCRTSPHESSWWVSVPRTAPALLHDYNSTPLPPHTPLPLHPGEDIRLSSHSARPLCVIEEMCVRAGMGVCSWLLFTRNESKNEPQWEGRQRCRIFLNEITPYTSPPPPAFPASSVLAPYWSSLPISDVRKAL